VVDETRRDLAVAADAVAGRFTHNGVTLDLGRRPDWLGGGLAGDVEWRIEWVKLYEGLDLAHAHAATGDPAFLAAWEDLVESFCDQVPVGHDSSDVSARRVQNWLYAWQRFGPATVLRPGLAERLAGRITADADHLAAHLTAERNHRTLELYTLLLVGIAVDAGPERALAALELLAGNAATDVWDDGVHRECSTDYHLIVLRSFVGAVANARLAGLPVPAALLDRTHLACDFALHVQRPDGTTPALSDGDEGDFRPLLATAGELLDRPDLTWAATAGRAGTPPERRHVTFPVGGYCVQRSGWGDGRRPYGDERFCVLDCGPLGDGGHGHYDHLSVEMAAGGRRLVVDPGRYTYVDGGWRRWFKGTAGHSTVTVDGLDQTPYRCGKPKGPTSTARLVGRTTVPGLDLVVGEATSPSYDAVHTRAVALVDDDWWVVHDRLRAGTPHRYEARWHLAPEAAGRTTVDEDGGQFVVRAPGLVLCVPRWCGTVAVVGGWVSPAYGVKVPAPVVVVTADGRADADIVTAVVPGDEPVDLAAACCDQWAIVRAERSAGRTERVWWRTGRTVEAGWERRRC
jgi:Heparinase II/III-like protein/Heparinase II/III N-terminus